MDDYITWIKQTYHNEHLERITASGHNKIKQVKILLERHADAPLSSIGYNEVEAMFYCGESGRSKRNPSAARRKSALNLMGELQRFLRWLHRSPTHAWRKPDDFDDIDMAVDHLPQDHAKLSRRVSVFTLDELVLLNQYRKFARKHRASLSTAVIVAASLLIGTAVSTWQAVRATAAE
jgi:hypothetical protein